jgi:hypothetical protein
MRRWAERSGRERDRPRTAQSFCIPKADVAAAGYDLSLNRYREVEHSPQRPNAECQFRGIRRTSSC